ncbi:MAG: CHAT domain-containing protein [Cyanobacteria bacterium P01_D01_bin.73]
MADQNFANHSSNATLVIPKTALERSTGSITLSATTGIVVEEGLSLDLSGSISFSVSNGPFSADQGQEINTNGRGLSIGAASIRVGDIGGVSTITGGPAPVVLAASQGNIDAGDIITASSQARTGQIQLSAREGNINAGVLNTSSSASLAGFVDIEAPKGNVTLEYIDSRGLAPLGVGASVFVSSGGRIRITGGFRDEANQFVSISASTADPVALEDTDSFAAETRVIVLGTSGFDENSEIPFRVGDPTVNGTKGNIQTGLVELPRPRIIDTPSLFTQDAGQAEASGNSGVIRITTTREASEANEDALIEEGDIRDAIRLGMDESQEFAVLLPQSRDESELGTEGRNGYTTLLSFEQGTFVGKNDDVGSRRQELSDRISELTGLELVGNLEHLRAAEYGNHWGVSYQVPVVQSSFGSIQELLRVVQKDPGIVSAVLYTFAHKDELELVLVLPTGEPIRHTVENVSLADLTRTTSRFRRQLTNRSFGNLPTYLPTAQKLYSWLIAPIREDLERNQVEVIQFSLGTGLRSLPVAALHDGEQFLIENFAVAAIPSFALLDTEYQSLQGSGVLVAGTSEFDTLSSLPAVPVEAEAIGSVWNTVELLNEDFTLEEIKAARRDASFAIAHMATHAFFEPGDPNDSFVQLWGNERISLDEMSALNFSNPPLELLVLSACRTAVGDEQAELGFAGLSVQSGAKSVVASLWQVSDSGTLALMSEFYTSLSNVPAKAEALRQAQLAMLWGEVTLQQGKIQGRSRGGSLPLPNTITDSNPDFSHPYFWSGFTLVGSPW